MDPCFIVNTFGISPLSKIFLRTFNVFHPVLSYINEVTFKNAQEKDIKLFSAKKTTRPVYNHKVSTAKKKIFDVQFSKKECCLPLTMYQKRCLVFPFDIQS